MGREFEILQSQLDSSKYFLLGFALAISACVPEEPSTSSVPDATTQGHFEESPTLIPLISPPPRPIESDHEAKTTWLLDNAIVLDSISPGDQDFSDLEPLKAVLADKRIVLLGERTHGDGAAFLAKTRLIKFLHQEMGFDVLIEPFHPDEEPGCITCMKDHPELYKTIYTRKVR